MSKRGKLNDLPREVLRTLEIMVKKGSSQEVSRYHSRKNFFFRRVEQFVMSQTPKLGMNNS